MPARLPALHDTVLVYLAALSGLENTSSGSVSTSPAYTVAALVPVSVLSVSVAVEMMEAVVPL
ncbi:hypothetical protein D3C72_1224280 [compost metagenome]